MPFLVFFPLNGLPGNLAQAEAVGREALELIPNDHSLMFSLANVLGKSQKYKVSNELSECSVLGLGFGWFFFLCKLSAFCRNCLRRSLSTVT